MSLSLGQPHCFTVAADADLQPKARTSSHPEAPISPIASRKDGIQSSVLDCGSQVSYEESKADVRNGLAEPRASRILAQLGAGEEELPTAESAPLALWCCYSATSPWKPFAWLTTPKLFFLFSPVGLFLVMVSNNKFYFNIWSNLLWVLSIIYRNALFLFLFLSQIQLCLCFLCAMLGLCI